MPNNTNTSIGVFAALQLLFLLACFHQAHSSLQREILFGDGSVKRKSSLIPFTSPKGKQLFLSNNCFKLAYFPNAANFVTQKNQGYCGPASAVMTLNNVVPRSEALVDPIYSPYPYYTQDAWIQDMCVKQVLGIGSKPWRGMSLEQEAAALSCTKDIRVSTVFADDSHDNKALINLMKMQLQQGSYIIANILRTDIDEKGYGHFSPIAAFHEKEQRETLFLFMDVARYKYGPVWVPADELVNAMRAKDPFSGRPRGFLIVSKQKVNQTWSQADF
uniref:glutathione gamma-glutamylcysteinyltransferase n=2 Tax=Aplanochytrium stocchinoi TaxID=215587 RepID=A0A7S3PIG0_9STRA|mmetsp:Transcript_17965/g.22049  ORF Transcript_17965/g.22049 Transcript_17965/m.22049 type:complete len:274 (+) Transcript_17965:189-1010(+)